MKITIKQPALDFLRQLNYPQRIAVRIAAVMSGGCGCTYGNQAINCLGAMRRILWNHL